MLKKTNQRFLVNISAISLLALLLLIFPQAFPGEAYGKSNSAKPAVADASGEEVGQADVEVRGDEVQLSDDFGSLQREVPGVGALFGAALDKITSFTGGSESPFKEIAKNLPLLPADLYKVFIKL